MSQRLLSLPLSGREAALIEETTTKTSFNAMKAHINGSLTMLAQGTGWEAYVDDEGMLKNLPLNEACAYLLNHLDKSRGAEHIWGPAVFLFESSKNKAFIKASDWFERYKSETLSVDGSEEDDDDDDDDEKE